MKTLRGSIAAYWAQVLADERRPAPYRLKCAGLLAHMALADWDSTDRRRRAAAHDAGGALLRLLEALPFGEQSSSPPVDGGLPSTAGAANDGRVYLG